MCFCPGYVAKCEPSVLNHSDSLKRVHYTLGDLHVAKSWRTDSWRKRQPTYGTLTGILSVFISLLYCTWTSGKGERRRLGKNSIRVSAISSCDANLYQMLPANAVRHLTHASNTRDDRCRPMKYWNCERSYGAVTSLNFSRNILLSS